MKSTFWILILFCSSLLSGCAQSPTSPNSNGWIEVTAHAPFKARYGLSGTVFNNAMWVIGGAASDASASVTYWYGDVWSSGDGANWTQDVTNGSSPFGSRYGSQALSFNGKIWLIGGNQTGTFMNDVWNSSDGVSWVQVLPAGPPSATQFSAREDFGAVVFNNLMWVIGGSSTTGVMSDVWSSPDGITWTQVSTGGFPARWGFVVVSFNHLIWIFNGASGTPSPTGAYSDTWSSPDGIVWTKVSAFVSPGEIYYLQAVVNNGQIWKTGGYSFPGYGATNEVYNSPDGLNWSFLSNPPYPNRFYHLSLSFNNQVWIIAGMNNYLARTYYNDVWHGP